MFILVCFLFRLLLCCIRLRGGFEFGGEGFDGGEFLLEVDIGDGLERASCEVVVEDGVEDGSYEPYGEDVEPEGLDVYAEEVFLWGEELAAEGEESFWLGHLVDGVFDLDKAVAIA